MIKTLLKLSIIMFFALCITVAVQSLWLPAEWLHLSEIWKAVFSLGLCIAFSITATAIMLWEQIP